METPITAESVKLAGEFIESLIPNVEDLRLWVAPTAMEDVTMRVTCWLLNDLRRGAVSLRELTRAINRSKEYIWPTLIKLMDEGVLEEVQTQHNSPGRPHGPRFLINWPRLIELYAHR